MPEAVKVFDEISIDFKGPFEIAASAKKDLVSLDNKSSYPDAKFLYELTSTEVLEYLRNNRALFGVPRRVRTDPGSWFRSESLYQFYI